MRTLWVAACLAVLAAGLAGQDATQIVISSPTKLNLAVPDFTPSGTVAADVQQTFNQVLSNDLLQSAVITVLSRSLYTADTPASEAAINQPALRAQWLAVNPRPQRLVFGTLQPSPSGGMVVDGFLYDITQPAGSGRLLARRYANPATAAGARAIAHQLANDVIAALGFGPGIAASQIAFISNRSGSEEVWTMDYDGFNQQQRTHLHSIAYSPRISPDGKLLAFISYAGGTPQIKLLSLENNRLLPFPTYEGLVMSPAWSPDGTRLAFAAKMGGQDLNIYTVAIGANGRVDSRSLQRLTHGQADNFSPAWDPRPPANAPGGGQIVFNSSRIGMPQIYTMNGDGSGQQRIPFGGYAVSPAWSPNGTTLAFAWVRSGGENDGALDIYLWIFGGHNCILTGDCQQMTHNGLRNDNPSWAPDGRHIVFQSGPSYHKQLFTVAADGSNPVQLTTAGDNEMPNWSWH